jgi:signal peptidase II
MNRVSTFAVAAVLIGADRLLKWWVIKSIPLHESRPLIGQTIRLTRVHNAGGAMGILPGGSTVFLVVSLVVSLVIVVVLLVRRYESALMLTGLALLLGGAIGNAIDRLAYGYVLDFLEIKGLFVNNLADVYVSVGAALLIFHVVFGGERKSNCEAS